MTVGAAPGRGQSSGRRRSRIPTSRSHQIDNAALSDREIVRVAREIIAKVGVDGLTMRQLSTELGVSLGSTYHHVPTKRDLLVLVARDLFDEVTIPSKGKWDERLKSAMVSVSDLVERYPGIATFMSANPVEIMPIKLYRALVQILTDAGFPVDSVNAVMATMFFYVTGTSTGGPSLASSGMLDDVEMKRLFEDGLDLLLAGARVRVEQPRRRTRSGAPRSRQRG
jgi:TetR/AcrR family transcriptional regulator, tetracycline repressor protein